MWESRSSLNFSSYDLEQEVLSRFRSLVQILPLDCQIHREMSNNVPVICLDFEDCPMMLEVIKENISILQTIVKRLHLANCIIFRIGNNLKAWRHIED